MMVKDTADYLSNSQGLAWVRKYKLTYIFKYSFLLFRVVKKGNPALLFQDFAVTLASEGSKRWLYLYLHDRITIETHSVYKDKKPNPIDNLVLGEEKLLPQRRRERKERKS